jgi:hypothetical protein
MSGLGMRSPRTGALLWLLVTVMAIGSGLQKNSVVVDGALGVNWGTISNNPLPPGYVAKMLRASNLTKVKIFDSDFSVIRSMAGEDIEVMVAAPNNLLAELASDPSVAVDWVTQNITQFLFTPGGVKIKWVAVGNEPFLTAYNNSFVNTTFPALQNMQNALNQAGHSEVRAVIPFNADVMASSSSKPSTSSFKSEYLPQLRQILSLLNSTGAPFIVNLYPFISAFQAGANFPLEYAFFDGPTQITDGNYIYNNELDASYDSLVIALAAEGYPNMSIVLGEVGWPTDGTALANNSLAQKFNQELVDHFLSGKGTPRRPGIELDGYLFSLLDEDAKSVAPGPFERHWGIYYYDGTAKYQLNLAGSNQNVPNTLVNAVNPPYMAPMYCVLASGMNSTNLTESTNYACTYADCTDLLTGGSCSNLTAEAQASYAFNSYFQAQNQNPAACDFQGLAQTTTQDPSQGTCKFNIGLQHFSPSSASRSFMVFSFLPLLISAFVTSILLVFT